MDEIEQQLAYQPNVETRNRKLLDAAAPGFEHEPPLWELRVGDYRVFYDADEESEKVFVRAVQVKGRSTTQEIIHERDDD